MDTYNINRHKDNNTMHNLSKTDLLPCHIVNLKSDVKRRLFQEKQAIKHNFSLHIHSACSPQSSELNDYKPYWMHNPPLGEDAICMSFKKLFDSVLSQADNTNANKNYLIICEDDTQFCHNFRQNLELTLNQLPKDWQILHLGPKGASEVTSTGKRYFSQWPGYPKDRLR